MIKSSGKVVILNNIPFSIDEGKVLRELRFPRSTTIQDIEEGHIANSIKDVINLAYSLIKGKGCYRTFKIKEVSYDRIIIPESDHLFSGNNMVRLLKNCDYATLLVCTIGKDIAEKVEELEKISLSDAYNLDRTGAWMADYMAEQTGRIIEAEIIKNGYKPTFRYAAGYGDWELKAQAEIMRLTEAHKIGVSITDSFIMIPRFSVSAVIGWEREKAISNEGDTTA
ncbi:MAG: vitamin B12 dependent-methionine synthase activation domain-containing protein [Nitrospira sp.]|nr:vitamin B12 dependent-methionine synthase activation domain-containing protein [Nitrospira sp.]